MIRRQEKKNTANVWLRSALTATNWSSFLWCLHNKSPILPFLNFLATLVSPLPSLLWLLFKSLMLPLSSKPHFQIHDKYIMSLHYPVIEHTHTYIYIGLKDSWWEVSTGGDTFGCWPCKLFLQILKVFHLYFIWHMVHKKDISTSLSWLPQTCLSWSNLFISGLLSLISFFFFFLLRRLPLPLPRCLSLFSVYPRALGVLPFLSFSLSLTQCVRRENWPHKKWKGLFKRNGSIMKTYYCIPWCAACGCRRWPAAILFS